MRYRSKNKVPEEVLESVGLSSNGHKPFHLTDAGNAARLAARHGKNLRFVHAWNRWLVWDGKRWKLDDTGEVVRLAKETVHSMLHEADPGGEGAIDKDLAKHSLRSESRQRIEAMIALAQSEPGIPVTPDQLDQDPWLLTVENGTLDLRTGELREHQRGDLITKLAPVVYEPEAEAPTWSAVLERVLKSESLRRFVQRAVGYSLTGDTRERILLLLYGIGRNGKTTLLEAIREALGDYALKTPAETLMAKPSGGIPNDVARLKGARFVSASETEANRRLAEALVKEITGSDTISARFMRAEWFDFRPTHHVWLATNHKPQIVGTDPAIWDRIKLVPFEVRIPAHEVDKKLPEKLRNELPGILAWAVKGCLDWQREGLGEPDEVQAATEQYRTEMDVLAAFIEECCVVKQNVWVTFKELYAAYAEWAGESNERVETKRSFGMRLTERGFEPDNGPKNVAIRRGIALQSDQEPGPPKDGQKDHPDGDEVNQADSATDPESPRTHQLSAKKVNPQSSGLMMVNPENTCKTEEKRQRVNEGYPKSGITSENDSHRASCQNQVNSINHVNPKGTATGRPRRLTEEEARRVQKLISEGMLPRLARAAVLREEAGP